MAKKQLVAVITDGTFDGAGPFIIGPEVAVPYTEGMKWADLETAYRAKLTEAYDAGTAAELCDKAKIAFMVPPKLLAAIEAASMYEHRCGDNNTAHDARNGMAKVLCNEFAERTLWNMSKIEM